MTKEELIKNQFPNDEFLQSGVSQIVDKCIAELEKENAKLRKDKKELCHSISEGGKACVYLNDQLTKAKEIIKELYEGLDKLYLSGLSAKQIAFIEQLQDKAEQFLNSEVEK